MNSFLQTCGKIRIIVKSSCHRFGFTRRKTFDEEREDFIPCRDSRLSGLINEMRGDDTMRQPHIAGKKFWRIVICGIVGQHTGHESIAKSFFIGRKMCTAADDVTRKTISEHGKVFLFQPLAQVR